MKILFRRLPAILLLVTVLQTSAQDSTQNFHSTGVLFGYGRKFNMDAEYNPVFLQGSFSWQFDKKKRKKFLAFYLEPQFNLVNTGKTTGPVDFEFGINTGLRYYQRLFTDFYLYQTLSSGPHFITAVLERQAKGFIFSDNLSIGFFKKINAAKPLFVNFQASIRHISNAGLKTPNWGVNTVNFLIGFSRIRL